MNKVIIAGYIGNDIEVKYTQNDNKMVANFSVGTRESKDKTEWHRCITWEKTAEFISKYFKKGSYIALTGHLQTRKWEDKDGKTMYSTEIIVETAEFGGNKEKTASQDNPFTEQPQKQITDDPLPF